jgi:hypothetical protein
MAPGLFHSVRRKNGLYQPIWELRATARSEAFPLVGFQGGNSTCQQYECVIEITVVMQRGINCTHTLTKKLSKANVEVRKVEVREQFL